MSYDAELSNVTSALALLSKYSVEPVGAAEGFDRSSTSFQESHKFSGTAADDFSGFRHEMVKTGKEIAFVHLEKNVKHEIKQYGCGSAGTLQVQARTVDPGGWVPAYFLPWDELGAAVEMTIPSPNSAAPLPLAQHPQVFFTAALSGCSVVFKGTPQNPTIYHCGSGASGAAIPYDANQFWHDFVDFIDREHKIGAAKTGVPVASEATKRQYVKGMVDPIAQKKNPKLPSVYTTQTALDYQDRLKDHYGKQIEIEEAIPWGAVFGLRNGPNWTFYLQENVNVKFYTRRQAMKLCGLIKSWEREDNQPRLVSRPMVVRQVFPGGGGAVVLKSKLKSLLRTDLPA